MDIASNMDREEDPDQWESQAIDLQELVFKLARFEISGFAPLMFRNDDQAPALFNPQVIEYDMAFGVRQLLSGFMHWAGKKSTLSTLIDSKPAQDELVDEFVSRRDGRRECQPIACFRLAQQSCHTCMDYSCGDNTNPNLPRCIECGSTEGHTATCSNIASIALIDAVDRHEGETGLVFSLPSWVRKERVPTWANTFLDVLSGFMERKGVRSYSAAVSGLVTGLNVGITMSDDSWALALRPDPHPDARTYVRAFFAWLDKNGAELTDPYSSDRLEELLEEWPFPNPFPG